jgi:hypothetical protein
MHTSQKTHLVPVIKADKQMIFRPTLAVYSDNYTEHINTVSGQNEELLIQITWYIYVLVTVFKGEIESYWLLLQFWISLTIYFSLSL